MALTPSTMPPLGMQAPDFSLLDTVSGSTLGLQQLKSGTATVIMFICNHCPYVKHVQSEVVRVANQYGKRGIAFIAISSNDSAGYPEDGPDRMRAVASEHRYPFPYLFDRSQQVAQAYKAACTPDFYVFDRELKLVYRGQMDDSRPGNGQHVTGRDLRAALDAILVGTSVDPRQIPSAGCNIKWVKTRA